MLNCENNVFTVASNRGFENSLKAFPKTEQATQDNRFVLRSWWDFSPQIWWNMQRVVAQQPEMPDQGQFNHNRWLASYKIQGSQSIYE